MKTYLKGILFPGNIFLFSILTLIGQFNFVYSQQISGIQFQWSSLEKKAEGSDNWPMTWSDDDHQYTHFGDGGGFNGSRVSFGIARIEGDYNNFSGINRFGGDNSECTSNISGKTYGIISVQGTLYAWVSPGSGATGFQEQRLYSSTDKGCRWNSTNVVFKKNSHGITGGNILNFGRDNAGARDEYVYSYFVGLETGNKLKIQSPGNVYLVRVPADEIQNASAYEWYTATNPSQPMWGEFSAKQPVYSDPTGVSWSGASVIHVPELNQYVLTTEHTESFQGNIQMHVGLEPWGPWREILRESNWPPTNGVGKRSFYWNFAPKWFRNGGIEFTLVFSGIDSNDSWNSVNGTFSIATLPVELTRFDVISGEGAVLLDWETSSELNNAGFEVQQYNAVDDAWRTIAFIEGHGTTDLPQIYSYQVQNVQPGLYSFRLKQVDFDGKISFSSEKSINVTADEKDVSLSAFPNPFLNNTNLKLYIEKPQRVIVKAYNALGREISLLYSGEASGNSSLLLTFDGGNLPPGMYLIKAQGETFTETRSILSIP